MIPRNGRATAGMSFVEIIIASSIFALVIAITFGVLHYSSFAFSEQIETAGLQQRGEKALREIVDLVADSKTVETQPVEWSGYTFYDAEVRFRVPVSNPSLQNTPVFAEALPVAQSPTFPGDFSVGLLYGWRDDAYYSKESTTGRQLPLQGPCLNFTNVPSGIVQASTKNEQSGLTVANSTPDGFMVIRFKVNPKANLGSGGILDEAVEQVDVDNDSKYESKYVVGMIERCYFVDNNRNGTFQIVADSVRDMADSNIILPLNGIPGGDSLALNTTRIFEIVDNQLVVTLFLCSVGERRLPRVTRCSSMNFLRNK
jgi:hypothetical protein